MKAELCVDLELNQVIDRNVGDLSGGELQRFAIAVTLMLSRGLKLHKLLGPCLGPTGNTFAIVITC
jgi:translation initiation factor RLI1